jgi:hypothetical protein
MHLVAMACIGYESFIGRDLSGVLKEPFGEWEAQKFIDETEVDPISWTGGRLN